VLACATLWTLAKGTNIVFLYPLSRRQHRYSLFRLGLDYLQEGFRAAKEYLELYLVPDIPSLKTVVT
jgi:hypothetical protein